MAVESISYSPNPLSPFIKDDEKEIESMMENMPSCQKQIKEVINQSLIDSGELESQKGESESNNISIKLNELSCKSDETLVDPSSVENVAVDPPVKPVKRESGSRATPKQVYPNIACLPSEDNIIYCFILSVWDNIVGPQTVYVWKKKTKLKKLKAFTHATSGKLNESTLGNNIDKNDNLTDCGPSSSFQKNISFQKKTLSHTHSFNENHSKDEYKSSSLGANGNCSKKPKLCLSTVVTYVTEHAVSVGESCRRKANKLVSHLLTVPQQNIIILSVRFSVMEEGVGVPYCLSAVIPSQDEFEFLSVIDVMKDSMFRIIVKLRLLITKDGLGGGDKIRGDLLELCSTVCSLNRASLSLYPLGTLARIPDDRRFAERILTSHLQTMGTSVVIAESPHEANRVVMWLGQFLSEEEVSTSRIALSEGLWPFQPGVSVQAVIRDPNGSIDLSSSKLLTSNRPLTLIDLSSYSVRQMAPMNIHSKNSSAALRMQLLALWHDLDQVPAPSQSLFEPVETSAPLVKRFLHEWDTLASCEASVKKLYRVAFLRTLQYLALSLIMWTRHEWSKEKRRKDKSILQTISSALCMEEPDLKIILACAEKLEPGLISSLLQKTVKKD